MSFTKINGAQIYYETRGEGEPLVLVHAGIADSRMWAPQMDDFAARYHVVRYDMRGYGQSKPVEGTFSHTDNLRLLLDTLNIERAVLVGCSLGGKVCIDFALAYPDRVRALVLVGAIPAGYPLDEETLAAYAEVESAADDLSKVNELEALIWVVGRGRDVGDVQPDVYQLAAQMNLLALQFEVQEIGEEQPPLEQNAVERLNELLMPALIIYGEHDRLCIHAVADVMAERLPNARKVLLNNAAHLPNLDQPAAFNRAVLDFLETL